MSERIHELAYQLFGKSSVKECELQEIKDLTNQYPYFAPAQFLLLEKLKEINPEEYSGQVQKAVLYYHNPLEFERFIHSDRFFTEISFEEKQNIEERATKEIEAHFAEQQTETSIPAEEIEATSGTEADVNQEFIQQKEFTSSQASADASSEHEMETLNELQTHLEALTSKPETNLETIQTKHESAVIKEPETPNAKPETDLVFEPYHTVDYFASQGIKLSLEEVTKDKLGKQLKSFTEWLKTMKKIPQAQAAEKPESSTEKQVQHLAEDSVHKADVLTEAMAEVWLKQGSIEKALEVYNKLRLLHPSKSAYFAAKIENLKTL